MTIQGRLVKEHSNDSPTDYGPVFDPKFYPEGSLSHAVMEVWKSKNPREALEKAMKERKREVQELEEEGAIYNSIKQLQKAKEEKRQFEKIARFLSSYTKRKHKRNKRDGVSVKRVSAGRGRKTRRLMSS